MTLPDLLMNGSPMVNGAATILDTANRLIKFRSCLPTLTNDEFALWSDWHAVGQDIYWAINEFQHTQVESEHVETK